MSHIVNPSLYRIGKNIYWNVLYSSNYKSIGMRFHLILNLTLLSIFRMLNFRVIKIFINVENYKFKLIVAGFRLTKLYRLTTDLDDIKLLSNFNRTAMYPPIYFGGSDAEHAIMSYKAPYFNIFMKGAGFSNKRTWVLDSFNYLSDFEHYFTKNLVLVSKWAAENTNYNKVRMQPLIMLALKIRAVSKIIESRDLLPILIKNPKAYYFLIFKNFFIMASAGIKILKKSGFRKWYITFKNFVKPFLRRLLINNILPFKSKTKLNPFSLFGHFCLETLKVGGGFRLPFPANVLKKKKNEFDAILSLKKILRLIVLLKKYQKFGNFSLKLSVLLLIKIIIKNVLEDYAWFPKKPFFSRGSKVKLIPSYKKINDFAALNFDPKHELKKKSVSSRIFSSKIFFFTLFNNYSAVHLKKKSGARINLKNLLISTIKSNFSKKIIFVRRNKRPVFDLKCKRLAFFNMKSYFYLTLVAFDDNSNFYNWALKKKLDRKNPKADVIGDWLTNKLFILDLNLKLSQVFSLNIQLNLFTFKDMLANSHGYNFFKNVNNYMRRVFIVKKDRVEQKLGLILSHFALFFKSPHVLTAFIAEAIQYRSEHFRFVRPFSMLLGLLNLNDYGLSGLKIGFYGRLNGRDRKFRYYIIKGVKPNLLSLELNHLDYAEHQSITRYGVVHIHVWMYSNNYAV